MRPLIALFALSTGLSAQLGPLPATFQGKLPCADCPGIAWRLNLFPDQTYFLRRTYLGRNSNHDELGRYRVSGATLELTASGEKLAIEKSALRKLDMEGRPIESKLNYTLRRTPRPLDFEPSASFSGMFQYRADAASFVHCATGRRFPVAAEQAYSDLERAYSKLRRQPGEELMAELEGTLALRPKMEGPGKQWTLVATRFHGLFPGESCGQPFATASLRDTYWKITRLGGEPVLVPEGRREPHLQLRSAESRLTGFDGCNNFTGVYSVEEDRITLGPVAGTLMACLPGMNYEGRIPRSFDQVRRWRIRGEHLELLAEDGAIVMRLESRYMK